MYDTDVHTAGAALQASSAQIFSASTLSRILDLTSTRSSPAVTFSPAAPDATGTVTVAAGAEVVLVAPSSTPQTVHVVANAPVVVFQGTGGVNATVTNGAPATVPAHAPGVTDRVIVGTAGNDNIVVADHQNSLVVLGTGNSTVVAGAGSDTVQAGLGNSTVVGGTGHAIVALTGNASNYTVTVQNGHAVVTDATTHKTTDISKIQYVQLDNGKALVFANDAQQAAVTTLYQAAFGRTADANGLQYWFDKAAAGESLAQIAIDFTKAAEFAPQASLTDTAFINGLYLHTFGRAGETGGIAYWAAALANGTATRAQLIANFSDIASHNIDGTIHTEATVIGSVTIVHNII